MLSHRASPAKRVLLAQPRDRRQELVLHVVLDVVQLAGAPRRG